MADTEPELKLGSSGEEVKELQELLLGSELIKIDGNFGPETELLVKAFQASHGLIVDGIVGSETWKALRAS